MCQVLGTHMNKCPAPDCSHHLIREQCYMNMYNTFQVLPWKYVYIILQEHRHLEVGRTSSTGVKLIKKALL